MKLTKRLAAIAACAVMATSSMVGMSASAGYGNGGQTASLSSIPLITQPTSEKCSAATFLQFAYGLGKQNTIPGNTDVEKINWIWANETTAYSQGKSVFPYTFKQYFNSVTGNTRCTYSTGEEFNSSTDMLGAIHYSLGTNYPVAIHCDTKSLSYYNGYHTSHFIAISESNIVNKTVTCADCNNNSKYGGMHYGVSAEDIYQSIKAQYDQDGFYKEHYLIYGD